MCKGEGIGNLYANKNYEVKYKIDMELPGGIR